MEELIDYICQDIKIGNSYKINNYQNLLFLLYLLLFYI
jgi:hypothetical protein